MRTIQKSGSTHEALFDAVVAKEENLVGKKLMEERKAQNLTMQEIVDRLAGYGIVISRSALSKWESGLTIPNAYQMLAISAVFGVDDAVHYFSGKQELNWEGRQKLSDYKSDLIATGKYAPEPIIKKITYIRMPVSYLSASAGTGDFLSEDSFEMVNFPASTVPAGADFAIKVNGDSMEPVYTNGQTVWVKKCTQLKPGEVGIFTLDGNGYIKMYDEQVPENPEEYTDSTGIVHMQPVLVSYNEKYNPIVVTQEQRLEIVGKVL